MNKKLLYFNLAVDENDTSLGFAIKWIDKISEEYEHVDVITLRKDSDAIFSNSVNIFGPRKNSRRLYKYIYFYKTLKHLLKSNTYERCFSHMSPISIVIGYYLLSKNKIKTTLWFTHPGPKFGVKKIILFLSMLASESIVTASRNSFPFNSHKVNVIGHAIDLKNFTNKKEKLKYENFLILSRISRSKNLEIAIESFLNSKFKESKLDIVGGTLNEKDEIYLNELKKAYPQDNVNFLGKVEYRKLPELLKNYDIHFNCAQNGFFDKSVLETLSSQIINFYRNEDFNLFFNDDFFKFQDVEDLTHKLNELSQMSIEETSIYFDNLKTKLEMNSLSTLNQRLKNYL